MQSQGDVITLRITMVLSQRLQIDKKLVPVTQWGVEVESRWRRNCSDIPEEVVERKVPE